MPEDIETERLSDGAPRGPGDNSTEFEVKLAGGARKLRRAARAAKAMGAKSTRLDSAYYDTPDRQLRAAGCSFRLRRKGECWELTLKRRQTGSIGRGEWTAIVNEPVPDVSRLPADAPLAELGLADDAELAPVFRTEVDRLKYVAGYGGAVAEIAIDDGRLVAGGRSAPVREIELELISGAEAGLIAQARGMAEAFDLAISPTTKADRGYALADGQPPAWIKAAQPVLSPDMTVSEALRRIVGSAGEQIHGNIAAAADGSDPEGVHQLRVALRRLRSAVEMFQAPLEAVGPNWRRDAGASLKALGEARDLDVFLTETLPAVAAHARCGKALEALGMSVEQARGEAYDDVRRMLRRRWFTRLVLEVLWVGAGGSEIDDKRPLPEAAARLLEERLSAVRARGENFESLDAKGRHRVRIAVKKLRYAMDFFVGLYSDPAARKYQKTLRSLQEDLGALNDAAIAKLLSKRFAKIEPKAGLATEAVIAWSQDRLAAADEQIVRHWREFAELEPFWR